MKPYTDPKRFNTKPSSNKFELPRKSMSIRSNLRTNGEEVDWAKNLYERKHTKNWDNR